MDQAHPVFLALWDTQKIFVWIPHISDIKNDINTNELIKKKRKEKK